ncbi:MAG: sulfite exporter TauE/SafE family protein [Hydrotalea sp.]|nr:sulfite exporter TauE/SafE family protein [Hydrotalea sp.]
MTWSLIAPIFALSLLRGIAHSFEADHLAAVAMLNAGNNASNNADKNHAQKVGRAYFIRRTLTWAVGHGIALFGASFILWYFFHEQHLAEKLGPLFDGLVGAVMIGFAIYYIVKLRRAKIHLHRHRHNGVAHLHLHSHARSRDHQHRHSPAALLLGLVHGLSGSGDVVVLGILAASTAGLWFVCLIIFSLGVIASMLLLATVISRPLVWLQKNFSNVNRALSYASCFVAIIIGVKLIHAWLV